MSTNWTPHDYQLRSVEHMVSRPGAAMFADPGLGKTSTTLAAYSVLKDAGKTRGMLVVAPLRPCYKVWPAEIAKWADFHGLSWTILHGPQKDARLTAVNKVDIYIVNYDGLKWLSNALAKMKQWPFDVLCLDESTKIKHTATTRFKVLKAMRDRFSRVWALTGTPAPNGLEDLFGQIYMLDGGQRLGRFITHFRREYFNESPTRYGYSLWEPRRDAQERIQGKLTDIAMTLRADDYLKMPRLIENKIEVELPAHAREIYNDLEDEFYATLNKGEVTAVNAAAKSMKLRQIVGGGVYGTHGAEGVHCAKIDALVDLIEEQEGQPLLVAVGFHHEVERIRAEIGQHVPYLGGGVTVAKSNQIVDDWNAGKIPVLLVHPTSVAHGLNLQAGGNAICFFTLTWNLEEHVQVIARVHRQGQTKPCIVHYILAADTIDQRVQEVLTGKASTQNSLMNALKQRRK
jgi:SNF2 family DNA or RNA helicase